MDKVCDQCVGWGIFRRAWSRATLHRIHLPPIEYWSPFAGLGIRLLAIRHQFFRTERSRWKKNKRRMMYFFTVAALYFRIKSNAATTEARPLPSRRWWVSGGAPSHPTSRRAPLKHSKCHFTGVRKMGVNSWGARLGWGEVRVIRMAWKNIVSRAKSSDWLIFFLCLCVHMPPQPTLLFSPFMLIHVHPIDLSNATGKCFYIQSFSQLIGGAIR